MARLSRAEQQERTRQELVVAAERIFLEKGFHATSVEEVAEEAGYSKGAVYANFEGKDGLFLSVLERRFDEQALALGTEIDPDLPVTDQAQAAGEGFWRVFLGEPDWALLLMEFAAHAARDPQLREPFARRSRHIQVEMARLIDEHLGHLGLRSPVPSDKLASILFALGDGVIRAKLIDPDGVADDVFTAALGLLFEGIVAANMKTATSAT